MSRVAPDTNPREAKGLTRAQGRLYAAGYAVLVAGCIGSVVAYRAGFAYDARNSFATDPIVAKQNDQRLEDIGGKSNVFAHDTTQWFAGLWHGTHLGYTLGVLTLVVAGICFFMAYSLPDFPPFDDSPLDHRDPRPRKPDGSPDS
jgi:hypothetical protein